MHTPRLSFTPTMLLVTAVLLAIYIYGYIDQIDQNNRSLRVYETLPALSP